MEEEKKLTRVFICLEFPDPVIKEIARLQEVLSNKIFTGKMTELENLHLTFKFLGEIDDETIEKVKRRLDNIKFDVFEAKLGELGTFSFNGKPKIVWTKVNGDGIWALQKKIDEELKDLFELKERFMSHMTLARIKYVKDGKNFSDYVKNIVGKEIKFNVTGFKLKSSELSRTGPIYREIKEFKSKD